MSRNQRKSSSDHRQRHHRNHSQVVLARRRRIVIVDVPPDLCLSRQGEKLTSTGISNSQERKLSELRELALLLTAEVVDAQLEILRPCARHRACFGTHERFLVCMTPHSNALAMIESGNRNKERFQGISTRFTCASPAGPSGRESRFEDISMPRKKPEPRPKYWKATIPYPQSSILRVRERITQIFIGHSAHNSWRDRLLGIRCSA